MEAQPDKLNSINSENISNPEYILVAAAVLANR